MLSFRRETDYAIQFLRVLSKSKKEVSLNDVSDQIGVSFLFLQKIARKLRQNKIVEAVQGVKGGYKLLIPAGKLSLLKIVSTVEGDCCLLPCLGKPNFNCGKNKNCCLKVKIGKLNTEMTKILEKIKLSDL